MKKVVGVLLALMMVLSLAACGESSGNGESTLYGTWNAVSVKVEGSKFTIEELEAMGDDTMSDLFFVIKEGGKAYVYSEGYGELVDWSSISGGIKIGVFECSISDGFICVENNGIIVFLEKRSDSQTIPAISDEKALDDASNDLSDEENIENETPDLAPGEHVLSGFDEATNQKLSFCGIDFSFPAYFDVLSEDSTETYKLYYPETKDYYATLMFQCADLSATQEDFDSVYLSSIVDSMIASLGSDAENRNEIIEYSKSEKTTIVRMSGWIIAFSLKDKDKGVSSYGSLALVYNINTEQIITILCGYESKDQSNYDYLGDYEKILKSAVLTAGTSSNNTSVSTTDTVAWKQFLKDYEIWVDDYIAFMKKYQANPTDLSLLTDYIKMMDKVSEWEEDSEKMEAELNDPAELAEYTKEYMRILTKMTTGLLD